MKKRSSPISTEILVLIISLCITFVLWQVARTFPAEQIPIYVFVIGITSSFFLFGMVFALTRAKEKTGELDIEHSRLIAAIESIPIGIAITDTDERIIHYNYGLSEVLTEVGVEWTLKHMDDRLKNYFPLMESYKKVLTERRTINWKKVQFESRQLNIYLGPIFSEAKGLLGVLILIRDTK